MLLKEREPEIKEAMPEEFEEKNNLKLDGGYRSVLKNKDFLAYG